jgi:hypothetical protein
MSRRDTRRAWIPCRRCVTSEAASLWTHERRAEARRLLNECGDHQDSGTFPRSHHATAASTARMLCRRLGTYRDHLFLFLPGSPVRDEYGYPGTSDRRERRYDLTLCSAESEVGWSPQFTVNKTLRIRRRSAAMRIQYQFRDIVLAVFRLSCFAAGATAQESSQEQDLQTPQGEVARPSTYYHSFAAHSSGGSACMERRRELVPVARHRFGMRCNHVLKVLCVEAHRKTAIGRRD